MKKSKQMNDSEIQVTGIQALNKALGPAGALKFLSMLRGEQTDYVKISRRLYQDQTIDEIFDRARKDWKETTSRHAA